MRVRVGVAVDGDVVEMTLPDSVPVAHLLPEILSVLGEGRALHPRRVGGAWLDPERSLAQQGCAGAVLCLEERTAARAVHHDPVLELVDRGPPLALVRSTAAAAVVGGVLGAWVAACGPAPAALTVTGAPVVWGLLPVLAGWVSAPSVRRVRAAFAAAAVAIGAAALAAAGPAAAGSGYGVMLDGCVAGAVLAHVTRSGVRNSLVRVTLGAVEWWLLGAVIPLGMVAAGWVAL